MAELDRILEHCLGDAMPPCQATCPLHVDARGYVALIREGRFDEALNRVRETLPFPGILGRVCMVPCESECRRGEVDQPMAIASLKRSTADNGAGSEVQVDDERPEKIAIVGAGPCGLMAAYDLRRKGYQVTVFDSLPATGGMLLAGIPDYRLPRDILRDEVSIVEQIGVEVRLNTSVGEDISLADLRRDFAAVLIAVGAHSSTEIGVPGESLEGVYPATDFLRQVNLGHKSNIGERVAVVGGGNAAVDSARTALRLGGTEVTIVYRRSRSEMPAKDSEVEEAEAENVKLHLLAIPVEIIGNGGKVTGVKCIKSRLGEPDASGRRSPVPVPGSEFLLDVDTVIIATGQVPDLRFLGDGDGIDVGKGNAVHADPVTLQTGCAKVFAGGDAVTGPKTVVEALAAGRKAAISIDRYIRGEDLACGRELEGTQECRLKIQTEGVEKKQRTAMPALSVTERIAGFDEVELGFGKDEAVSEAERCLACECRVCVKECEFLKATCQSPRELAQLLRDGDLRENPVTPYSCNLCSLCERLCPEDLDVGKMCLEIRQQLVKDGIAPLPSHAAISDNREWVSANFNLSVPDPNTGTCDRVFFPGCNLSGYSPSLVAETWSYLRERMPGTGVTLGCCGAPTYLIGEESEFQKIVTGLESGIRALGASEIIAACPKCYHTLKDHATIPVVSLYEVMAQYGIPEVVAKAEAVFSIHDACATRHEASLQEAVRELVKRMEYQVEEMGYSRDLTRCCGMGGMASYANPKLTNKVTMRRARETKRDILSYCASCRDAFAFLGKPSVHVLDLMFNPDWEKGKRATPTTAKAKKENQALLKSQVEAEKGG